MNAPLVAVLEKARLADQALADFAAKEGLVLDAPRNTVTIEKKLGEAKRLGPGSE